MRPSTIVGTLASLLVFVALAIGGAPDAVADDALDAPLEVPSTAGLIEVTITADVVDPDDGETSLREAVDRAVSGGGDVTIRLVPGERHSLECGPADDANISGDLDIAGNDLLVIDGAGASIEMLGGLCSPERVIDVIGTATLVLDDLVIDGSSGVGNGGAVRAHHLTIVDTVIRGGSAVGGRGGAVYTRGDLVVLDSVLTGNKSLANGVVPGGSGGAAHVEGDVLIRGSRVQGNEAAFEGGGIAVAGGGRAVITDTVIDGNSTQFGRGGAVFAGSDADVEVTFATIAGNSAGATPTGGGAFFVDGHLTVADSSFTDNEALSIDIAPGLWNGGGGGAIYSEGEIDVARSIFDGNTAGESGAGGAIHHKGTSTVVDSSFTGNTAGGAGGAVYLAGGNDDLHSIVVDGIDVRGNSSGGSGGGGLFLSSTGPIVVNDSRVSANTSVHTDADGGGILVRGRATISSVTVDGNAVGHRGSGGGIHVDEAAQVLIENSVVTGNRAASGGGVDGDAGPGGFIVLRHSTVTDNHAPAGSQLSVRSLLRLSATIIGLGDNAAVDPALPWADVPRGGSCRLVQSPISGGHNVADDESCLLTGDDDLIAAAPLVKGPAEIGRHLGLAPLVPDAIGSVNAELCETSLVDLVGAPRPSPCDAGAIETSEHLVINDDVIRVNPLGSVEFDLLDNDLVGPEIGAVRFRGVSSPGGLLVSGSVDALKIEALRGAVGGVIGRYEVCTTSGDRCGLGVITVEVADPATTTTDPTTTSTVPPTTTGPTTSAPTTSEPTTSAPTTSGPGTTAPPTTVPDDPVRRWSFGYSDVPGWTLDAGAAFDGDFGWTLPDGTPRQCGVRGASADPVLDGFCHAVTRYARIDGLWRSYASPASWSAAVPDGEYEVTVTVGDATAHFGEAHSVQVEGEQVHDRVVTSSTSPFATSTVTVTVSDGRLDVTFAGGTRTKIVSLVATRLTDEPTSTTNTPPTTEPTTPPTTTPPTTTPPTTTPPTTTPPTTEPTEPTTSTTEVAAMVDVARWSFGYGAVSGWTRDIGAAFDGDFGWSAADGTRRQCGVRGVADDPVLDGFCHAVTHYRLDGPRWAQRASPASWTAVLPDGTYAVTITVGDASAHHGEAHSVQVEGEPVHDRVVTSSSAPFETSTVTVEVTDGRLDVTFDGGTRTKVVAIEVSSMESEVSSVESEVARVESAAATVPVSTPERGSSQLLG